MVTAPSFCDLRTGKRPLFGSLGIDYFGFFSQWGYPLSPSKQPLSAAPTVLARRGRKAQNFHDFQFCSLAPTPPIIRAAMAAIGSP
jgi:hypothetical protein